jgi:hypothetical protein
MIGSAARIMVSSFFISVDGLVGKDYVYFSVSQVPLSLLIDEDRRR